MHNATGSFHEKFKYFWLDLGTKFWGHRVHRRKEFQIFLAFPSREKDDDMREELCFFGLQLQLKGSTDQK
jgi:hypothetical protein